MSRRRPLEEVSERSTSSGADGEQEMADQDDDPTAPMAVTEKDLAQLCRMDTCDIKSMIRPDTTRIGKAFDSMMGGVKASGTTAICARSLKRHQDPNVAIERCFTAFSGRGKTSLTTREFARRLSTLSMEWSGNFSKEEYLALAQDIGQEDTPGIVSLESFKGAAEAGSLHLCPEHSPLRSEKGTVVDSAPAAKVALQDASGLDGGGGGEACHVAEFDDTSRDGSRSCARRANGAEGSGTAAQENLEVTLRKAASRARSAGEDVWKLLDDSIQAGLAETQNSEDDKTLTSDDVAAQPSVSQDVLRRFLSKLDVQVLPSPVLSPTSRPQSIVPQGGDDEAVASSFLSIRNAFEERSKGSRGESPIKRGEPTQSPPSRSPSGALASERERGRAAAVSSVCDRYLRVLSRDTASVRSRVQLYNQELARTLGEAESLISHSAAVNTKILPLSAGPDADSGCEQPPRVSLDASTGSGSLWASPGSVRTGGTRAACGDGGRGIAVIPVEVGGRAIAMAGSRGGGGTVSVSPADGPISAFSRISPVERADPSHPKLEIKRRPCSTPRRKAAGAQLASPSSPTRGGLGRYPGHGGGGGGVDGDPRTPAGVRREESTNENGTKIVASDRVAKLLLATLAGTIEKRTPSPVPPSPVVEERRIAVAPKAACFDPPSVRNGLAGLTADEVDKVLLRVEASTPGAVSCWKSPANSRRGPQSCGTERLTPSAAGWESTAGAQQRHRQKNSDGSFGWFDAQGSPRGRGSSGRGGEGIEGRIISGAEGRGGGGARRVRQMMKITHHQPQQMPPNHGDSGMFRVPPSTAQTPIERRNTWGIEQTQWAGSGGENQDASEGFIGSNPMYTHKVEVAEKHTFFAQKNHASPKKAGVANSSASRSSAVSQGSSHDGLHGYEVTATAPARNTRRPVRAFQRLDEDVYDGFLHCAKKNTGKTNSKGFRRAFGET
ncbi:unnamed protein product [Ectocarpus fasciculatus]